MSFSYGSKPRRHKTSGKHFKLFSDELPQIDFDKATMEEYSARINEPRRTRGRRRTFRDSNHDRFSLPSLGTPDWEKLSDSEKGRPTSYSPFNPLNPNFNKIYQKIHRRHTLKETKVDTWNRRDHGYFGKNGVTESEVDKNQYINAWQEIASQSQSQVDSRKANTKVDDDLRSSQDQSDGLKPVIEKPPIQKKRSVFQELLNAASKENSRMNQIKETLNFNDGHIRRHNSLRTLPSHSRNGGDHQINEVQHNGAANGENEHIDREETETKVPEIISEPRLTKPGILKHGARVRESRIFHRNSKSILPIKPRLIHQDDVLPFGSETHPENNSDEVKVSVHTAAPMNRVEDLVFVPLPSNNGTNKQKRVIFNEKIDIKEKTAVSDLLETNDDDANETNTSSKINKSTSTDNVKSRSDNVEHSCPRVGTTQIRRRANVKHTEPHNKSKQYVNITRRVPPGEHRIEPKTTLVPRVTKNKIVSKDYIDSIFSSKAKSKNANDLKLDPAWKEATPGPYTNGTELKHDLVISNDGTESGIRGQHPDSSNDAKTITTLTPDGRSDSSSIPVLNIPGIQEFVRNGNSASPNRSSPDRSPVRSPPRSPDIDFESLSEFATLFGDEFDIDLTNEIDRSMLGEDLIKAYRFWDRKKKSFPGGLRKIEAPVDRNDGFFSKDFGHFKSYQVNNPRLDRPPMLPSNTRKSTVNGVLMEWV